MSTTWTLSADQICTDALQHLGVLGEGEAASGGDMAIALRALDGVLKELPLSGYSWPKLSGEVALVWVSGQTIALPADYYAYPVVWRTVTGSKTLLVQYTHAQWIALIGRALATGAPTGFYISPDKLVYFYPTPTVDPVATLQYQKIVDDASLTLSPDLPQYWVNPLGYGVANELALKYGAPQDKRVEIAQRWAFKRDKALESSIASEVISFGVAD